MRTKILFILVCAFMIGLDANAQKSKIAYINTNALWQLMPEKAIADSLLREDANSIQKYYLEQNEDLKAKVKKLNEDPDYDDSKLIYQQQVKDIQERGKELEVFVKKAEQELAERREELYAPIREKMQKAIDAVAEKNDYEYVLDSSYGNIIYRKSESFDILEKVKKELKLD